MRSKPLQNSGTITYELVMARRTLAPLCLAFNRPSFLVSASSAPFFTASSPSVKIISMWQGLLMYGLILPWALYVRRRCLGAWLTWMCLTIRLLVSRPFVSAFASAFFRSDRRNSADFTGWRARETPNCLPRSSERSQLHNPCIINRTLRDSSVSGAL